MPVTSILSALVTLLTPAIKYFTGYKFFIAAGLYVAVGLGLNYFDYTRNEKTNQGLREQLTQKDTQYIGAVSELKQKTMELKKMKLTMAEAKLLDLLTYTRFTIINHQGRNEVQRTLRINVMRVTPNGLEIVSSVGMKKHLDRDLKFSLGQGCCGTCAETGRIKVMDMTKIYEPTWEATLAKHGDLLPLGVTKEIYDVTKDLKTIFCYPIMDPDDKETIIGVLNLDDKISIEESCFQDEFVYITVQASSENCSNILKQIVKIKEEQL